MIKTIISNDTVHFLFVYTRLSVRNELQEVFKPVLRFMAMESGSTDFGCTVGVRAPTVVRGNITMTT